MGVPPPVLHFLPARVRVAYNRYGSGWFVWIEINKVHSILTIMFKNILRTFETEILKISKNIQPQLKN